MLAAAPLRCKARGRGAQDDVDAFLFDGGLTATMVAGFNVWLIPAEGDDSAPRFSLAAALMLLFHVKRFRSINDEVKLSPKASGVPD